MNFAIDIVKAQGASSIFTCVHADNDAACELYENAGFLFVKCMGQLDPKATLGENTDDMKTTDLTGCFRSGCS